MIFPLGGESKMWSLIKNRGLCIWNRDENLFSLRWSQTLELSIKG